VYVVGIGPGNLAYLTPRGKRAIADADVVGFETVVGFVSKQTSADLLTCGYRDEKQAMERFGECVAAGASGTAVLMGDPNHSGYQFVGKVEATVGRQVRVIPGISSLQIAVSRARSPMEETTFVTLHKSGNISEDLDRLREDVGQRHLLVVPRPFDWMPEDSAAMLLDERVRSETEAVVLGKLTHPEEAITITTLAELAERDSADDESPFSDLTVLAVRTV